jgi:hypothetical protein
VHEEIAVIAQNPLTLVVALDTVRQIADFLKFQMDGIGNRLVLLRVGARADYEVIGETRYAGKIQDRNVFSLFRLRRANCDFPTRFVAEFVFFRGRYGT